MGSVQGPSVKPFAEVVAQLSSVFHKTWKLKLEKLKRPTLFLSCDEKNSICKITMTTTPTPTPTPTSTPTGPEDQDPTSLPQNPDMNHMTQQQDQEHAPQQQNPESPNKILTLETPDPQSTQELDQTDPQDQRHLSPEEARNEQDSENVTPFTLPITNQHVTITTTSVSLLGGGAKRKKAKPKQRAQEKKFQKKLKVLVGTLKPIPFVPIKTLDFLRHEKLLKRLGLWDFIHMEFDRSVRSDLIAQLIATYSPTKRCSHVNGARINVSRADLSRALKLPLRKDRVSVSDNAQEVQESEESIGFIEEFVFTWVLLHEDTWIMPKEVLIWTKSIREGHFEKVDWAGLFWFMLEKELMSAPLLGNCYYASHLQCLIKLQKDELLREEPRMEDFVKEAKEEDEDGGGDVKMVGGVDDFRGGTELEEHNIELSLGQENVAKEDSEKERVGDEDVMDIEEDKEEEHRRWLLDEKTIAGEHFLRRCNLDDVGDVECEEEKKQEGEEGEGEEGCDEEEDEEEQEDQDGRFPLSLNGDTLEGITSENFAAAMEAAQNPFSSGVQIRGNSGEFLNSRTGIHTVPGCSSLFGNGNKREIGDEIDISHHSLDAGNKRLRTDAAWDDKSSDFDTCMEQVHNWMGKARMLYVAKEQACGDSSVSQQMLLNELQERNTIIEHLHKSKFEDQQKRNMEVYRLERELHMMANLIEGYRNALKETQKAFAEYRRRCSLPDEPLYKDVKGSGGLVLSTMELEKERLKQEEVERMNRISIQQKIKDFEIGWLRKFEAHKDGIHLLGHKMHDIEKEVKILKELFAKREISGTPSCATPSCATQSEG